MTNVITDQKFSFDTDFEMELAREEEERRLAAMPKEPTFTQSELDAQKSQSFEEGKTAGLQEAKESLEANTNQIIQKIGQQVVDLSQSQQAVMQEISEDSLTLFGTMIQKVFPKYVEEYGLNEIHSLIQNALEIAVDAPAINIFVHPDMIGPTEEKIKEMSAMHPFEGKIEVTGNDSMGLSDCEVRWGAKGGAQRNATAILEKINALIDESVTQKAPEQTEVEQAPKSDADALVEDDTIETSTSEIEQTQETEETTLEAEDIKESDMEGVEPAQEPPAESTPSDTEEKTE